MLHDKNFLLKSIITVVVGKIVSYLCYILVQLFATADKSRSSSTVPDFFRAQNHLKGVFLLFPSFAAFDTSVLSLKIKLRVLGKNKSK